MTGGNVSDDNRPKLSLVSNQPDMPGGLPRKVSRGMVVVQDEHLRMRGASAKTYGDIFMALGDAVQTLKGLAEQHMLDALQHGLDPADFKCDWSLVDLGLAEPIEGEVNCETGAPAVRYLTPED